MVYLASPTSFAFGRRIPRFGPDLRGYGDTDAPPCAQSYTSFHVVGDLISLIDHFHIDQIFLVGHDWDAIIAWHFSLFRPDRIKALVNLSVPFTPRNPTHKPVERLQNTLGDDFYICRFQEPGEMEKELDSIDTAKLMKKFLVSRDPEPPCFPKGKLAAAAEKPITLPSWLSEEDINYFADKFKQTGFTGGLNYYRSMDLTWELMAPWTGMQVKVPAKFILGELDITYRFPLTKNYIHNGGMKRDVPLLDDVVIMEGAAHFINQERPEEISKQILDYFDQF